MGVYREPGHPDGQFDPFLPDRDGKGTLLIDIDWIVHKAQLLNRLKVYKIGLDEIKYVMFSHHHPDHANLAYQ
jgi:hypothetical protein